jgi:hypothetical protein
MKLEKKIFGEDVASIRLLMNYQDYEGIIYINVKDLQTGKGYNLSWNMEVDDEGMWFWSLADYETLTNMPKYPPFLLSF